MNTQMMRYMTVDEFYDFLENVEPVQKKNHVSLKTIVTSFTETLSERALFLGNKTPVMA